MAHLLSFGSAASRMLRVLERRRTLRAERMRGSAAVSGEDVDLDSRCIDGFIAAWRPDPLPKD